MVFYNIYCMLEYIKCIECLNFEFLNLNDRAKNIPQDDSL